ncbi:MULTISPECIES: cysteine desulfurase-like protein [unclassified Aliivibrio]|uniref:cysteine desulfurase-like protein n=1 Tax=unclassified Aliivibrio TaxID=2645654 RepID=UPI00080E7A6C|nr:MULTISPECIES: cysteine desulfurase-like protein [unclassified Aliivibrio]OCH14501.1 cysteine desulfurase-like protein [Aliivibrio sp. 1S128]OCH16512.1 cysteine desulfurase-like protein [Aliivibrio sp. 1S165]OCH33949.1 cysteine desulfurase-like protein [Aliivibrio sp. 1S175]
MIFTPDSVRSQFPALSQTVDNHPVLFLDGPGGSQVPTSVLTAMAEYLGYSNSNLGGHFFSSQKTNAVMDNARTCCAALLNAPSSNNIVFGANMTSLTFQLSRAISRNWTAGDEIIVTALDHYSNVSSWQQAAEDKGVIVHQVRVNTDDCTLDMDHFHSLLSDKTVLVATTYASNTTGSLVDVKSMVAAAHHFGAMIYVDAVHYAPHHLVDVQDLDCDFLVCSAYKFFGPHVGIAYVSSQYLQSLSPYKVEPATDIGPGRFETGTQSFEGLAGVTAAIEYLAQWGDKECSLRERLVSCFTQYKQHELALTHYFLNKLEERSGMSLFGISDPENAGNRTPTFAISFKGHSPDQIAKKLGQHQICVWNGHFYALGLIKQLGLEESGGVVRIGFMHYNTFDEIDYLFSILDTFE